MSLNIKQRWPALAIAAWLGTFPTGEGFAAEMVGARASVCIRLGTFAIAEGFAADVVAPVRLQRGISAGKRRAFEPARLPALQSGDFQKRPAAGERAPVAQIKMGKQAGDPGAHVSLPVELILQQPVKLSWLKLEISYPADVLQFVEAGKGKRISLEVEPEVAGEVPGTEAPGAGAPSAGAPGGGGPETAASGREGPDRGAPGAVAPGQNGLARLKMRLAPNVAGGALAAGQVAILVFRIKHDSGPGKVGLAASGSAALLDAGDLPNLLPLPTGGGEVEILPPRLEDVESSGGMRNLNPYVVTGCFFYMH